jgi:hypothetical protein
MGDIYTLLASELIKGLRGITDDILEANNTLTLYLLFFNRVFYSCEHYEQFENNAYVTTSPKDLYRPVLVPFLKRISARFSQLIDNIDGKNFRLKLELVKLGIYVQKYEFEFILSRQKRGSEELVSKLEANLRFVEQLVWKLETLQSGTQ